METKTPEYRLPIPREPADRTVIRAFEVGSEWYPIAECRWTYIANSAHKDLEQFKNDDRDGAYWVNQWMCETRHYDPNGVVGNWRCNGRYDHDAFLKAGDEMTCLYATFDNAKFAAVKKLREDAKRKLNEAFQAMDRATHIAAIQENKE